MVTVLSLSALAVIDEAIKTAASPLGIVSFELCAYGRSCGQIVAAWSPHARLMAALSLGVDYLFMVAYPLSIFLGLWLVARRMPLPVAAVTHWVAWSAWIAGSADAVENYALARMLLDPTSVDAFGWLASGCATLKFCFLLLSLGWLIGAALIYRRARP